MARRKVYRAALIPFVEEGDEVSMLFMKPSKPQYGGDKFQLAKGKQEEGESLVDTALREAKEELGLFEGNVLALEDIGEWLGRTTVFVCHIKDRDMFGDPHYETGETRWMTLEDFDKDGRDLHKPIVKAAHRKMIKIIEE